MPKYYIVESHSGWFVCYARDQRDARKLGNEELWHVNSVRQATDAELESYCAEKQIDRLSGTREEALRTANV